MHCRLCGPSSGAAGLALPGAGVHTLWCPRAQQCHTPLCMSVQRGQGRSPCRAHTFESGRRSTCHGVWCPLLQHNTAGSLSLLHVEHYCKQCAGHSECTCGACATGVGALVTALRRTVTEYGACGTRPDPMTGNRSLANVGAPPPLAHSDEDGIRPVFKLPAKARCKCASSTSSAIRHTRVRSCMRAQSPCGLTIACQLLHVRYHG